MPEDSHDTERPDRRSRRKRIAPVAGDSLENVQKRYFATRELILAIESKARRKLGKLRRRDRDES